MMISETAYLDQVRNCVKFNKKFNAERRRQQSFFDQQTGIAQRPSDHLIRHASDRFNPIKPTEVIRYKANKWRKRTNMSFDAVEFKYILSTDPALKHAVESLINPEPPSTSVVNEASNDSTNPKVNGGKTNFEQLEYELEHDDDFEPELSDEDDWGDKKKKKKKARDNNFVSRVGRRSNAASSSGTTSSNMNSQSQVDSRPFQCTECGARYKSRPGLTYHRLHSHSDQPNSPIVASPSLPISDTCDFCEGTKFENKRSKKPEDLVSCHDCGRSAHPTCLKFTPNMIISTKRHGWQCIECKSCAICGSSDHDDKLLFCDDCDRGFHCFCLTPPLKKPPENEWSCLLCQNEFGDKASNPKR